MSVALLGVWVQTQANGRLPISEELRADPSLFASWEHQTGKVICFLLCYHKTVFDFETEELSITTFPPSLLVLDGYDKLTPSPPFS